MSNQPKIFSCPSLQRVVARLRDDFRSGDREFVLLFAHNGTGKTRLSTEFKNAGKTFDPDGRILERDTLYFNAFTEDLFSWDNDLENDRELRLLVNSNSSLIDGFSDLGLADSIEEYFRKYCTARFEITRYTAEEVAEMSDSASPLHHLYRRFGQEVETRPKYIQFKAKDGEEWIKISRGEERIFVWSVFLAIFKQVLKNEGAYSWVKHLYIDDPVSSLDDNNAISVACDLAHLLRKAKERTKSVSAANSASPNGEEEEKVPVKVVVSSHHALFFNVIFNELKTAKCKHYFLHRLTDSSAYTLRATDDTPFFHHVALLSELIKAADPASGALYGYHFNMLRSILEKTAIFFGKKDFSDCIGNLEDKALFARALNFQSHGRHSIFEPVEMPENDKVLFRRILNDFRAGHHFEMPALQSESLAPSSSAAPPAKKAIAPPAKKAVAPPAKKAIAPPAKKAIAPPAKKAVAPPAKKAVAPPAKKAAAPPAKKAAAPPAKKAAAPPAKKAAALPAKKAAALPAKKATALPAKKAAALPAKKAAALPAKKAAALPAKKAAALPAKKAAKYHVCRNDQKESKATGQYPLGHRRPTARGDGCGRFSRLYVVLPLPALSLGQL
jgi:hypothetical protein